MLRDPQPFRLGLRLTALASVSLLALPNAASAGLLGGIGQPTSTTPVTTATAGPVKPFYGNIQPFYGNIQPFYGNIQPFYGNIQPFYGNVRPFWGDMTAFWGNTGAFFGDLSNFWGTANPVIGAGAPDYRQVGAFWTTTGGTWDQIAASWRALPATGADYQPVAGQIQGLVDSSRAFWGSAVQARTGQTFDAAFSNPLLAKYGIDLADPSSLASLNETQRALFFLDWYDGLMNFSGTDHVDHWMKSINWTPAISQQQGGGAGNTIGILDMTVVGDATLQKNIIKATGISTFTNGHGAAVAGLIIGSQDGQGVMGLAPKSQVVAYNPFDSTGTASWADITTGVQKLKAEGANVVNMSLGVPGITFDPGWNGVFTNLSVTLTLKNTVFVMAAGNEGVSQTTNVPWGTLNPAFIVVGSVDVTGNISNFSNRPGSACLTPLLGICTGDKLMNHFIVAPGELILVSDGHGGLVRESGTSFAAPQVSGAIGLLQGRWPWLTNYPNETVSIILNSAKDLGAPGVDPVYGHGLLDVAASQAPLNFNSLIWYSVSKGVMTPQTSKAALTSYRTGSQATWDATGAYFYAYEPIGLTKRDFAIPLSQKLVGQSFTTPSGAQAQFQAYLLSRLGDWAATQSFNGTSVASANRFGTIHTPLANRWGADMSLSIAPRAKRYGFKDEGPDYQSALRIQGERTGLTFGFGDGAPALAGSGFVQAADYDGERGGADPLLGLASGGAFGGLSYGLNQKLRVSMGVLVRDERRDTQLTPALAAPGSGARTYQADAQLLSLSYTPVKGLTVTGAYTRLHEGSGLLGIQSLDPADFRGGSATDGLTLNANWALTSDLSIMASGTVGRTRAGDQGQTLAVGRGGLTTSAFEVGVVRQGLFAGGDHLRLSVSQPMYVERGQLNLQAAEIVDRQTGEIGVVTRSVDIAGKRRIAAEALYGLPVSGGQGEVSLFGRAETQTTTGPSHSYMAGARYRIQF